MGARGPARPSLCELGTQAGRAQQARARLRDGRGTLVGIAANEWCGTQRGVQLVAYWYQSQIALRHCFCSRLGGTTV